MAPVIGPQGRRRGNGIGPSGADRKLSAWELVPYEVNPTIRRKSSDITGMVPAMNSWKLEKPSPSKSSSGEMPARSLVLPAAW